VWEVFIPYGPLELQNNLTWVHECGYSPGCLFDIEADPTEHVDLAHDPRHAARALDLAAELAARNQTLFDPDRGTPSIDACLRGIDIGRFYGPFAHVPEGWYTPLPPPSPADHKRDEELRALIDFVNAPTVSQSIINTSFQLVPRVAFNTIFPTLDSCRNITTEDSQDLHGR